MTPVWRTPRYRPASKYLPTARWVLSSINAKPSSVRKVTSIYPPFSTKPRQIVYVKQKDLVSKKKKRYNKKPNKPHIAHSLSALWFLCVRLMPWAALIPATLDLAVTSTADTSQLSKEEFPADCIIPVKIINAPFIVSCNPGNKSYIYFSFHLLTVVLFWVSHLPQTEIIY